MNGKIKEETRNQERLYEETDIEEELKAAQQPFR